MAALRSGAIASKRSVSQKPGGRGGRGAWGVRRVGFGVGKEREERGEKRQARGEGRGAVGERQGATC
eukprot:scaffold109443_cov72-Phaeocystis_antarctica.AAC.3